MSGDGFNFGKFHEQFLNLALLMRLVQAGSRHSDDIFPQFGCSVFAQLRGQELCIFFNIPKRCGCWHDSSNQGKLSPILMKSSFLAQPWNVGPFFFLSYRRFKQRVSPHTRQNGDKRHSVQGVQGPYHSSLNVLALSHICGRTCFGRNAQRLSEVGARRCMTRLNRVAQGLILAFNETKAENARPGGPVRNCQGCRTHIAGR